MAVNRLLGLFEEFDPQQVERVFGREFALKPPNPSVPLAPVKRVAIITEAFLPKVDGVSKSAFLTLNYLKMTGREVLILAPDIAPKQLGTTRIVPLLSVGFPGVPETRMALPNPAVARALHNFQPDVVHMFSPAFMSVSGMATARAMNIPIIANYQTDLPGYAIQYGYGHFLSHLVRNWLRYVHNGCHLTLVPSNHTMNELSEHGFKRLRQWGRGVDSNRFNPAKRSDEWRARLLNGRDPGSLLCIYVGRLATEKAVDLLLDVARLPGVALTIIGDGAQRAELESLFAGTGTYFTGYLFGEDLPGAIASADVFLFTGPNETFGQVVQEAMASGLPTIVTNRGGCRDLVKHGETGYISEHEASAFAEAARCLRDDPDLRRQMGQQARQTAETRPWEAIMAQLEGYYAEAVALNNRFVRVFGHTRYHMPHRLFTELIHE
jgi:glycosyltransferase involved in cell wall biosynthesis